jgi:L-lactate dehydrogenase complex protein LldG
VNAREEILARIQRSLAAVPRSSANDHEAILRAYIQAGKLDTQATLELFEQRLRDYNADVYRSEQARLPEIIASAMNAVNRRRLLVADSIPDEWLPSAPYEFFRDQELTYDDLDRSEGVLTTCVAAIAQTGTIVLRHSAKNGRRALTLIPDYHLCVVRSEQIVETVPEAVRVIGASDVSPITTISGPSATADIEMTRIKGVHGPRVLNVIIVQN